MGTELVGDRLSSGTNQLGTNCGGPNVRGLYGFGKKCVTAICHFIILYLVSLPLYLQAEVEAKTRKLRKLFTKLQTVKQEIVDVTEEYNRDRRDLEDTQQQLLKELKLKMLIIDNFISPSDKEKLMSRAAYDDETDLWILQPNAKGGSGSAIHKRPVSAAGSRRPMSEYARVQSGLRPGFNSISGPGPTAAALRFKGENIMRYVRN